MKEEEEPGQTCQKSVGEGGGTDGDLSKMTHSVSGWMAYWRCPSTCGKRQLSSKEPVSKCKILAEIHRKKLKLISQ